MAVIRKLCGETRFGLDSDLNDTCFGLVGKPIENHSQFDHHSMGGGRFLEQGTAFFHLESIPLGNLNKSNGSLLLFDRAALVAVNIKNAGSLSIVNVIKFSGKSKRKNTVYLNILLSKGNLLRPIIFRVAKSW